MAPTAPQAFAPPLLRQILRSSLSSSSSSPRPNLFSVVNSSNKNKRYVFSGNGNAESRERNDDYKDGTVRTALVLLVPCEDAEALRDSIGGWLRAKVFDSRGSLSAPVCFLPPCSLRFSSDTNSTNSDIGSLIIGVTGSLLFSKRVEITVSADRTVPGEGGLLRDFVDFIRTSSINDDDVEVLYKRRNLRLRKQAKDDKDKVGFYMRGSIDRVRRWAERYQLGQFSGVGISATGTVLFRNNGAFDVEVRDSDGSLAAVVRVSMVGNKFVSARVEGKKRRAQTRRIVDR